MLEDWKCMSADYNVDFNVCPVSYFLTTTSRNKRWMDKEREARYCHTVKGVKQWNHSDSVSTVIHACA